MAYTTSASNAKPGDLTPSQPATAPNQAIRARKKADRRRNTPATISSHHSQIKPKALRPADTATTTTAAAPPTTDPYSALQMLSSASPSEPSRLAASENWVSWLVSPFWMA